MNKQNWTYKTFGEVGSFLRGKSIQKADFIENGFPCIHYGQIHTKFGVSVDKHLSEIPLELYNKSIIASHGDVIIAITSEDLEGSCKSTAWLGDYDIAVSSHAAVYKHNLNPKFIAYYLRSKSFYYEKMKYARGFKVMEIKPTDIERIPIPVPPIVEQERIVAELDLLQGIIEKKKEQLKAYDQLAQSIFYTMFGDPIDNPKGWETKKLGEIVSVKGRVGWKGYKKEDLRESGPLAIGGGHITENGSMDFSSPVYLSKEKFEESPEIIVKRGDLIMVQRGTIGRIGLIRNEIGDATINPCVLILRPFSVNGVYLLHLLLNKIMQDYICGFVRGVAQPMITQKQVNSLNLPLPPLSLQQEFAEKIEAIERQKALVQQSIDETQTMFDCTMDKYFG